MRMKENWGKGKILKAMMAGCLLFNNFSGLGSIINAAAIEQNEINSLLNGNANEESNVVNNDTTPDDSIGGNESEEMTPTLPGDGTAEGDLGESQKPEVDQPVGGDVPSEDEQPEVPEVEVPSEDEQPEVPEVEVPSDEESDSDSDTSEDSLAVDEEEIALEEENELFSLENRSAGSGLVQLWQTFPDNQPLEEGKSLSEIKKALQCQANHNLYPSGGQSEHATYVNSCYVDDALYLGEDSDYYYIYLSGYEGKVPKYQLQQNIKLDLNGDGKMVNYKVETVAYYIPGTSTYTINEEETTEILDVPELNYYDQTLDKYYDIDGKNIELYASSTVQSPSYYANENGTLIHYVTNNVTKAGSYSKVTVGKAPSWMSSGVKYYSYDGIYFYNNWRNIRVDGQGAVNQNNPFYSYYQYLPFRSKSNYSAGVFDNYTNSNGGAGGKLVNAGQYFYAVQDKYGINGALQYAMGIHESGWGKSSLSIDKNNLFGMNATDNNPYGNGTSFPSVEAGINYHADRYLSWGYTDPIDDARYFGAHVGNKGSGMNVKYASDPFWGEKIAGWYYRFDNTSGLKDYDYYTIGIKQTNDVYNIRSQSNTTSTILYQTKNKKNNIKIANYPVLIIGEENGFYKIKTDTPIIKGIPSYNSTYSWGTSNGYITNSIIRLVNEPNYRDPIFVNSEPKYENHVDVVGSTSNGLYVAGWGFIEGINNSDEGLVQKTIAIYNGNGEEVKRQGVKQQYSTDISTGYGGAYDYARYEAELDVLGLGEGQYNLYLATKADGYYKNEELKSNYVIDTGKIRIGNRTYRVFNQGYGTPLVLIIENYDTKYENHVDVVGSTSNGLYVAGWGFIEGINNSDEGLVQKTIAIYNGNGEEVKRQGVKQQYSTDISTGYGGAYDYARYEAELDVLGLGEGQYNLYLATKADGYYKNEELKSNYVIDTGKIRIGNRTYRVFNQGYGTPLVLIIENYDTKYENHVDVVGSTSNGLYVAGWGFIEGINNSDEGLVQKTIAIYNGNGEEVKRQGVKQQYSTDISTGYGGAYDYARYEAELDVLGLGEGQYNLYLATKADGYYKNEELKSNYVIDTGKIRIGNRTYRVFNQGYGTPLVLIIENYDTKYENHVDVVGSTSNGLYVAGWGFIEGINNSDEGLVQKTIAIYNGNGEEVKRQGVKQQYSTDISTGYGGAYDYARYEAELDVLGLGEGQYNLYLATKADGYYKNEELKSNYVIDTGKIRIGNRTYRVFNQGYGTPLVLIIENYDTKYENHVDVVGSTSNGLYVAGWGFIEGINNSDEGLVQKTIAIYNGNGEEVKRQGVKQQYSTDISTGYGGAYDYARYEAELDVLGLGEGQYNLYLATKADGYYKNEELKSNYVIDTGKIRIGNRTYRVFNQGYGTPLVLKITIE